MKQILVFILIFSLLTSSVSAYELQFYHNDHLGSPAAVTDSSGGIVWKTDYEVFGKAINEEGANKLKYNTKEQDKTGLLYYGARYYNPDIGRFLTADTVKGELRDTQSQNRYTYVKNNPLKYIDPRGNQHIDMSGYTEMYSNLYEKLPDWMQGVADFFGYSPEEAAKTQLQNLVMPGTIMTSGIKSGVTKGGKSLIKGIFKAKNVDDFADVFKKVPRSHKMTKEGIEAASKIPDKTVIYRAVHETAVEKGIMNPSKLTQTQKAGDKMVTWSREVTWWGSEETANVFKKQGKKVYKTTVGELRKQGFDISGYIHHVDNKAHIALQIERGSAELYKIPVKVLK